MESKDSYVDFSEITMPYLVVRAGAVIDESRLVLEYNNWFEHNQYSTRPRKDLKIVLPARRD